MRANLVFVYCKECIFNQKCVTQSLGCQNAFSQGCYVRPDYVEKIVCDLVKNNDESD